MLTSAGGSLCCDKVIHAVGPKYNKNLPDNSSAYAQLKICINNIMDLIKSENIKSVSIPAISTGIFGFPIHKCAIIMGNTIRDYIDNNSEMHNREIVFCNSDDDTVNAFLKIVTDIFIRGKVELDSDENKSNGDEDSSYNDKKKKKSRGRKDREEDEENDDDQTEEVKEEKNKRNNKESEEEDEDEDEEDDTIEVKKNKKSKRSKRDRIDEDEDEDITVEV